jgi:hypothetical protein
MNITLKERKFSLSSQYDITGPTCKYYATKSLVPFRGFRLLEGDQKRLLARIRRRLSLFHARYEFQLQHGEVYRFWCEAFWRGVFACEGSGDQYRFYRHKGLSYSLFRADRQVASFVKNRFVIGKGNQYEIRVNGDENTLLVICIALVADALDGVHGEGLTVDVGNLGPEARPFDEQWEPN